jgi:3-oxoadipate enol-lactonase
VAVTRGTPRIAYETHGASGPPVLLIMGLGMRGALWKPQIEVLSEDHRLATYDHRGVGGSDPPTGAFRMKDMAFDALRVAGALGWHRFHVVGISMGGMVAQEVALAAPERVTSLSLVATHPGGAGGLVPTTGGLRDFAAAMLGPRGGRIGALERLLYPAPFLATVDREAMARRIGDQVGDPAPRRVVLLQLAAIAAFDARARLRDIAAPTLVVQPGLDALVRPSHAAVLANGIPGARLHAFPDAGHGVAFQHARPLSEVIRAHVAEAESTFVARRPRTDDTAPTSAPRAASASA